MSGTIFTTLKSKTPRVHFSSYTHLFAGKVLEHSPGSWVTEKEYMWSEGFSDSLHLGQVMFKTEMSLERSLQFK